MSGEIRSDDFEQRLIKHVEMLYSVALTLTHNARAAEHITENTLSEAWRTRKRLVQETELKPALLALLRRAFNEYRGIVGLHRAGLDFPRPQAGHGGSGPKRRERLVAT